jgi:hypothetical protein
MISQKNSIILPIKVFEYNTDRDKIEMIDQVTTYKSLRFASDWENVGTFTIEISAEKAQSTNLVVGRFNQAGS